MRNNTKRAVPLTWLLFYSQSTMDPIGNPRMLLNVRRLRRKDAICIHCNSRLKVMDRIIELTGYGIVWY